MPLPVTKSVKKVIEFLKKDKPDMSYDQMLAIAMSHTGKKKKKVVRKKNTDSEIEKAVREKLKGR